MSQAIADMLEQPEAEIANVIRKLEDKHGSPSHDVRMLAENIQLVRTKISQLGLDPDDTTGEELYHALLTKFEQDSRLFEETAGAAAKTFDEKSGLAATILSKQMDKPQWALKNSAAKDILRQLPPKRLMKHLNYRSLESLLKRESTCEVYLAAAFIESATWQKLHARAISKLGPAAYESRPFRVIALSDEKWSGITGPESYLALDNIMAAAGLWPADELKQAPLISMILIAADSLPGIDLSKLKLGQALSWWDGLDHAIANLSSEHVSLSLKDTASNYISSNQYLDRELSSARRSFWQNLQSRYKKLEPPEYSFDDVLNSLAGPTEQPAFEYVEETP